MNFLSNHNICYDFNWIFDGKMRSKIIFCQITIISVTFLRKIIVFTYFNNFDCPHCNLVEVLKFFTPWHTHSKVVKNSPKGKKGKKGCVCRRPHLSCFPSFFRQNISIYTLESQLVDWAKRTRRRKSAERRGALSSEESRQNWVEGVHTCK